MRVPTVSRVRFTRAREVDVRAGLLGFVSLVLDGAVLVDSLSLRRTAGGEIRLAYPERKSDRGMRHPIVAPLAEEVRAGIERQVLAQLGAEVEP